MKRISKSKQLKLCANNSRVDGTAASEYWEASCYSHWHRSVPVTSQTAKVWARIWEKSAFTCQVEKGLIVSMCQNCIYSYLHVFPLNIHSPMTCQSKKEWRLNRDICFIFHFTLLQEIIWWCKLFKLSQWFVPGQSILC